eukprot:g3871.t1
MVRSFLFRATIFATTSNFVLGLYLQKNLPPSSLEVSQRRREKAHSRLFKHEKLHPSASAQVVDDEVEQANYTPADGSEDVKLQHFLSSRRSLPKALLSRVEVDREQAAETSARVEVEGGSGTGSAPASSSSLTKSSRGNFLVMDAHERRGRGQQSQSQQTAQGAEQGGGSSAEGGDIPSTTAEEANSAPRGRNSDLPGELKELPYPYEFPVIRFGDYGAATTKHPQYEYFHDVYCLHALRTKKERSTTADPERATTFGDYQVLETGSGSGSYCLWGTWGQCAGAAPQFPTGYFESTNYQDNIVRQATYICQQYRNLCLGFYLEDMRDLPPHPRKLPEYLRRPGYVFDLQNGFEEHFKATAALDKTFDPDEEKDVWQIMAPINGTTAVEPVLWRVYFFTVDDLAHGDMVCRVLTTGEKGSPNRRGSVLYLEYVDNQGKTESLRVKGSGDFSSEVLAPAVSSDASKSFLDFGRPRESGSDHEDGDESGVLRIPCCGSESSSSSTTSTAAPEADQQAGADASSAAASEEESTTSTAAPEADQQAGADASSATASKEEDAKQVGNKTAVDSAGTLPKGAIASYSEELLAEKWKEARDGTAVRKFPRPDMGAEARKKRDDGLADGPKDMMSVDPQYFEDQLRTPTQVVAAEYILPAPQTSQDSVFLQFLVIIAFTVVLLVALLLSGCFARNPAWVTVCSLYFALWDLLCCLWHFSVLVFPENPRPQPQLFPPFRIGHAGDVSQHANDREQFRHDPARGYNYGYSHSYHSHQVLLSAEDQSYDYYYLAPEYVKARTGQGTRALQSFTRNDLLGMGQRTAQKPVWLGSSPFSEAFWVFFHVESVVIYLLCATLHVFLITTDSGKAMRCACAPVVCRSVGFGLIFGTLAARQLQTVLLFGFGVGSARRFFHGYGGWDWPDGVQMTVAFLGVALFYRFDLRVEKIQAQVQIWRRKGDIDAERYPELAAKFNVPLRSSRASGAGGREGGGAGGSRSGSEAGAAGLSGAESGVSSAMGTQSGTEAGGKKRKSTSSGVGSKAGGMSSGAAVDGNFSLTPPKGEEVVTLTNDGTSVPTSTHILTPRERKSGMNSQVAGGRYSSGALIPDLPPPASAGAGSAAAGGRKSVASGSKRKSLMSQTQNEIADSGASGVESAGAGRKSSKRASTSRVKSVNYGGPGGSSKG